jgi:hypothetical protein
LTNKYSELGSYERAHFGHMQRAFPDMDDNRIRSWLAYIKTVTAQATGKPTDDPVGFLRVALLNMANTKSNTVDIKPPNVFKFPRGLK